MAQIDELQARITRALDRIGTGLDRWEPAAVNAELAAMRAQTEKSMQEAEEARNALAELQAAIEAAPEPEPEPAPEPSAPQADPEELAQLREALEDEKLANAQLEERLRTLGERQSGETAALREQVASQREGLAQLDSDLQQLRNANAALRETSAALRAANAQGVGDAELINQAMQAELDALRADRATETAEARAVLSALAPLLGAEPAPGQAEESA
ncbi:hypothetical protein [Tropicibacter oceani]|uniref:Colicin transporter n=1 Tax=Tropicibacter oceani TaxID=3058420 RepID=A0ABY8QFU8_9RHOB|nr:hypothetical protein [Tropicibacter oceani]WGW02682.1 hypothetical protein QF118_12115 [Tropicibacter oceani]